MNVLWQDLRYGLRLLLKNPAFALVVIVTLALGIGANTAIFSVINAVLLRPLPYPNPDRLVQVWETMPGNEKRFVAPGNFVDWRQQTELFEQLAGYMNTTVNLTGRGDPERLSGVAVSTNFFETLGIHAATGRTFLPEDVHHQDGRVVLLSHSLWQKQFGADPKVVGESVTLDGKSYRVVGIMPREFRLPARAEFWILGHRGEPVASSLAEQLAGKDITAMRDVHICYTVGRLKPNVPLQQAQAEMRTIAERLAQQYPETNRGLGANVISLHRQLVDNVESTLFILLGAVALVLLIACTNVANLLLARATQRERELAIRLALGAGRGRLIRQMLTESFILSFLGGLLGLFVGLWGVDLFVYLSPGNIPRMEEAGLDNRLLLFTLLVSLATGAAFGFFPALHATRLDAQHSLNESGIRLSGSARSRRARNLLVVAQIALAQVLLVGAGLLIVSFMRLQSVDPGFNPGKLLTARLSLSAPNYSENARKTVFYDQVLERMLALPGVRSAALVMNLPLSGGTVNRGFQIGGRPQPKADQDITLDYQLISPGYFATMEIPLVSGRGFTQMDTEKSPRVTIISQSTARKYFPGENPLGKRIAFGDASKEESFRTIVGIAGDTRHESLDEPPFPTAYAPYRQNNEPWSRMAVVLRAQSNPSALAPGLRRAILAVDPTQPVSNVQTMNEIMASMITRPRFIMVLLGALASVALALAAIGLYGLISYSITERTREIGIRVALGAQKRDVRNLIVGQGLRLVAIGVATGLGAAVCSTRLMSQLLFGISALDPLTFVAVPLLLATIALLATLIPTRRATRVDPMVALRYE